MLREILRMAFKIASLDQMVKLKLSHFVSEGIDINCDSGYYLVVGWLGM